MLKYNENTSIKNNDFYTFGNITHHYLFKYIYI